MNIVKNLLIFFLGVLFGFIGLFVIVSYPFDRTTDIGDISQIKIVKKTDPIVTKDATKDAVKEPSKMGNSTGVPILMYHYIKKNDGRTSYFARGLQVEPEMFEKQMELISKLGFETMTASDLAMEMSAGNFSGLANKVVLTFDDGYEDFYTNAWPILQKNNMTATVYLITDNIGKSGYLNTSQIEQLIQAGIEIGSHTLTHPNLANANLANARLQIENSKAILERMFSYNTQSFCYPSGKYNNQAVKLVKLAGYSNAVTTVDRFAGEKDDVFLLPRKRVSGREKFADFAYKFLSY